MAQDDVENRMKMILNRFKLYELKDYIIPLIEKSLWHTIKNLIKKEKLSLTVTNVTTAFLNILQEVPKEDLMELEYECTLIDVALHSHRRTWSAYILEGSVNPELPSEKKIKSRIRDKCRQHQYKCNTYTYTHDEVLWIMVSFAKTRRSQQKMIFGAYFIGERYILLTGQLSADTIIKIIVNSLGSKSAKPSHLTGHHIKSLFQLLKNKEAKSSHLSSLKEVAYQPGSAKVTSSGIDFLHLKDREKYAEECFGKNPPVIHTLKLQAKDVSWQEATGLPEDVFQNFMCSLTIKSNNIFQTLKDMTAEGVLQVPYPSFIKNLPVCGRNELTLKKQYQ